jgi:quercetin dioxygenase-like cupin family protein
VRSGRKDGMPKISKKEQRIVNVFDGITRYTLGCGKDVLLAKFEYKESSRVPPHRHAYEQVTTVIKGKQKILIRSKDIEEEFVVETGDTYIVPATFEHEQISLEDTVTLDAWSIAP